MFTFFSFLVVGVLIACLASVLITRQQPVAAALILVLIMVLLAGLYGLYNAPFVATAQVIVYAGAIMVVFVFVIMLLNDDNHSRQLRYRIGFTDGLILALCAFLLLYAGVHWPLWMQQSLNAQALFSHTDVSGNAGSPQALPSVVTHTFSTETQDNVRNVGAIIFTRYLWAFEWLSVLILVAVVSAVVLAQQAYSNEEEKRSVGCD